MDLSSALDVLQTASDDTLRSHAAKTILTLRQIGERLQVNLLRRIDDKTSSSASSFSLVTDERNIEPNIEILPRSPSQSAYESHHDDVAQTPERVVPYHRTDEVVRPSRGDLPATQISPTSNNHQPAKDVVSRLSSAMKRAVPWLWQISKKDQNVLKSYKRKTSEDRRLGDIRRVEGDPKPSELDKLFRLLAIRSLALDFTAEQMRENLQTKVDQLFDYVCSIDAGKDIQRKTTGRKSDVSAFVRRHPEIRDSEELANRAINNGIKHLVFEKALATKLQKQETPHRGAVVSAILGQSINNFKTLTYKRMPDLLDDLLSDKSKLSLPDDTGSEKEQSMMIVIRNTNDWFERLQAKYNDSRSRTIIPHCEGPNAKRARHNRSNCASRRSSPQPEHLTTPSEYSPSRSEYSPTRSDTGEPLATSQLNGETHAEGGLNHNNIPRRILNENTPQRGNLDPFVNFNPELFQNFNPIQDLELFQDFNPIQDLELFQDFNPVQDIELFQNFNPLEDVGITHFNVPELSNGEGLSAIPAAVST